MVLFEDEFDFIEVVAHETKDEFLTYENLLAVVQKSEKVSEELFNNFATFRGEAIQEKIEKNPDFYKNFPGL